MYQRYKIFRHFVGQFRTTENLNWIKKEHGIKLGIGLNIKLESLDIRPNRDTIIKKRKSYLPNLTYFFSVVYEKIGIQLDCRTAQSTEKWRWLPISVVYRDQTIAFGDDIFLDAITFVTQYVYRIEEKGTVLTDTAHERKATTNAGTPSGFGT